METSDVKNFLREKIAINRRNIPIRINPIPKKYSISLNIGNENAIITLIETEEIIAIQIFDNEFLSYEFETIFLDLVRILINISESNQKEQSIIIAVDHIADCI